MVVIVYKSFGKINILITRSIYFFAFFLFIPGNELGSIKELGARGDCFTLPGVFRNPIFNGVAAGRGVAFGFIGTFTVCFGCVANANLGNVDAIVLL